jgi:hypothetical protein
VSKWVPHSDRSFISEDLRSRARFPGWRGEIERAWNAVERAVHEEHIALSVLEDIGEEGLHRGGAAETSEHIITLNYLIAQTLTDRFGAHRVSTLWESETSPAFRTGRVGNLEVAFMVHRVTSEADRPVRVVLDTSAVRAVAHGDDDALDVDALRELEGLPHFCVADGAMLELLDDLLSGSLTFEGWAHATKRVEPLLDPTSPVAPGGRSLARIWGAAPPRKDDGIGEDQYRREVWRHMSAARSRAELVRPLSYVQGDQRVEVQLEPDRPSSRVREAGGTYASWFDRVAEHALDDAGRRKGEDEIADDIRTGLSNILGFADMQMLDLSIRFSAKRVVERCGPRRSRYKPTANDALDLELLFALPLPALVCTGDQRLIRVVRSLGSPQGRDVLSPPELLERLRGQ